MCDWNPEKYISTSQYGLPTPLVITANIVLRLQQLVSVLVVQYYSTQAASSAVLILARLPTPHRDQVWSPRSSTSTSSRTPTGTKFAWSPSESTVSEAGKKHDSEAGLLDSGGVALRPPAGRAGRAEGTRKD